MGPDTSLKITLLKKAQHLGALTPLGIVRRNPQVPERTISGLFGAFTQKGFFSSKVSNNFPLGDLHEAEETFQIWWEC